MIYKDFKKGNKMKAFETEDFGDYIVYKDHAGKTWKREDDDFLHNFYMLKDGALGDENWHFDGYMSKKCDEFYEEYDGISLVEKIHDMYIEKSFSQHENED